MKVNVKPILDYFVKKWMNGEYKPEEWNQFKVCLVRKNNSLEINNNNMNSELRTKPSILRFYDNIKQQENLMSIDENRGNLQPYYIQK